MKINSLQKNLFYTPKNFNQSFKSKTSEKLNTNYVQLPLGNIYGAKINKTISFGAYAGEENPANKLYYVLSGKNELSNYKIDPNSVYYGSYNKSKKWLAGVKPRHILNMSAKEAIETLISLNIPYSINEIPKNIRTPNFGDNWGRHANYIEINPRALGKMEGDRCSEGILGAIKMLNIIPPSSSNWANCVILSQLYPNIYGDGYNKPGWEENSQYTIKIDPWFNYGISENLTVNSMERNGVTVNPHEQIKAFNDLAHIKGIKTGFRMLVSEDQIKIGYDEPFKWNNPEHVEKFIDLCVNGIDMGFDAIYFDSAKHVGGYDMAHYAGVGATPSYEQMQYITYSIRQRTGRSDISFVGEKCDNNIEHFKNMGMNAGTNWGNADNINETKNLTKRFAKSEQYAPGIEVSNDNDNGVMTYEQRLNRINSCLFGFDNPQDKLPTFMQIHDLYPLNHSTNTHDLMLHNPRFSEYGDPVEHWNNLFADDYNAENYSKIVNELFAHSVN
ncbi:MAG: hypothetical protein E7Z91_01110 [Cyanobacteria bacterium SIG30]|nr:hypothetical protein [Cyanobacteria bacterium SIG30]